MSGDVPPGEGRRGEGLHGQGSRGERPHGQEPRGDGAPAGDADEGAVAPEDRETTEVGTDATDAARIALNRAREAARAKGLRPGSPGRRRRSLTDAGPGEGHRRGSGAGASGRDPQLLGDTAADLSRILGWKQPLSIGGVIGRWADVVGPQIAERCQPETFIDGDLVVRADSTAWATQIRLLIPQLERRLAEEVGEGVVTSIQVLGPGGPSWRKGARAVRGRGPRDTYG